MPALGRGLRISGGAIASYGGSNLVDSFTGKVAGPFTGTARLATAAGAGTGPAFGHGKTLIVLVDVPAASTGNSAIIAYTEPNGALTTGWTFEIVSNTTPYIVTHGAGGNLVNVGPRVNNGQRIAIAVAIPADGVSSMRWSVAGSTIATTATLAFNAPGAAAVCSIGNTGRNSFGSNCTMRVAAVAIINAVVADADLVAWTKLNQTTKDRNHLHASVLAHASLAFLWRAETDWDGVAATSTAGVGGQVFTATGTIAYSDIGESRYELSDGEYLDNLISETQAYGKRRSAFARARVVTDAASIGVDYAVPGTASENRVGVVVGATQYECFAVSNLSTTEFFCSGPTTALGVGSKTIDILNGRQDSGGTGTQVRAIRVPTAATRTVSTASAPTRRLVVFGDSIAAGYSPTRMAEGWDVLMRQDYPGQVSIHAITGRTLASQVTATLAAELLAGLDGTVRNDLWLAIGTNDYGVNAQSAANFGTQYAALLDAIHASNTTVNIFCQCPTPRTAPYAETANAFGDTLTAYRTAISTAVSARSGWAVPPVYVDASAWVFTKPDGLHPDTAGHASYKALAKTAIGY
jgi:lysophospholipase L1-like esterase